MSVTGAPSANQPFEDEEAHYQHHRDLQVDPSTLSRLTAYTASFAGLASNTYVEDAITGINSWVPNAVVVGDDLAFHVDYPGAVDVLTDGIYSVSWCVSPYSQTPDALTEADFVLSVNGGVGPVEHYAGQLVQGSVTAALSYTGFFPAAEYAIGPSLKCLTASGTWGVAFARLVVQRLA